MRMRRDSEAVEAYREVIRDSALFKHDLRERVDGMSDEQVIEIVERAMNGILEAGRKLAVAMQRMTRAFNSLAARLATDPAFEGARRALDRESE